MFFLFLCQFCWEWFPDWSTFLQSTWSHLFYGYIVFNGVYVPHFPCPVYHHWAFGLFPGLCYCKQCHKLTYMCLCLYNRMMCNPLGIYSVMGLLNQIVFLFLDPWGITTLSATMVELIYTPTNSVKAFLFLHILSSTRTNLCRCVVLFVRPLFCSIGLYLCFGTSTMLFWLL